MEGLTFVLFLGWIILVGCFAAIYFMDRAVQKVEARRAKAAEQATDRRR